MKGLRADRLETKLLKAISDGDDVTAATIERRILLKEQKAKRR